MPFAPYWRMGRESVLMMSGAFPARISVFSFLIPASITVQDAVNNTYTRQLRTIDTAAKDWGKSYDLPQDAYNTYSGTGAYLYYYMRGETLYGRKAEATENRTFREESSTTIFPSVLT